MKCVMHDVFDFFCFILACNHIYLKSFHPIIFKWYSLSRIYVTLDLKGNPNRIICLAPNSLKIIGFTGLNNRLVELNIWYQHFLFEYFERTSRWLNVCCEFLSFYANGGRSRYHRYSHGRLMQRMQNNNVRIQLPVNDSSNKMQSYEYDMLQAS